MFVKRIDDLIGNTDEAIEAVDRITYVLREHICSRVERGAVLLGDRLACFERAGSV